MQTVICSTTADSSGLRKSGALARTMISIAVGGLVATHVAAQPARSASYRVEGLQYTDPAHAAVYPSKEPYAARIEEYLVEPNPSKKASRAQTLLVAANSSDMSWIRVPARIHRDGQELCNWALRRYPPLASGSSSRELWIIYRVAVEQQARRRTIPAYLDCRKGRWQPADETVPSEVHACARAKGLCKHQKRSVLGGFVVPARGERRCIAAMVLDPTEGARQKIAEMKAWIVHEYVIHCGMKELGMANRAYLTRLLAERITPERLERWFDSKATATMYRRNLGKDFGFTGELELPGYLITDGKTRQCGPVFKSEIQAIAYRWYAEEALASLVSAALAEGTLTTLAARGKEEALAGRIAANLEALAGGVMSASQAMDANVKSLRQFEWCNADPRGLAALARALQQYIGAIHSKIAKVWRRPAGTPPGLKCGVGVTQSRQGEVLSVEIFTSSGNIAFDRSVAEAVWAASPLPAPVDPTVFDKEIVLLFRPRS